MIANILIIVVSAALFAYWFRYSCLLILQAKTSMDYAPAVVEASRLSVLKVQERLAASPEAGELAQLRAELERDYKRVMDLLGRVPNLGAHLSAAERFMLRADYGMMRAWDAVSRRFAGGPSRAAIAEMSTVVSFLANAAGSAGVLT